MKKSKIIVLMAVLLAVLAIFVACSTNEEKNSSSSKKKSDKCTDHDYEWTITRQPSCILAGKKEGVCKICGAKSEPEIIDALEHEWDDENLITVEATCKSLGSISHKCKNCELEEAFEILPIREHNYTVVTDTTNKYEYYKCANCDAEFIKPKQTDKDLLYWTCSETEFTPESLKDFSENIGVEESAFDPYVTENGNVVAAMGHFKDDTSCMLILNDKKSQLANNDFVIQFDVMLEELPTGGINSLVYLDKGGKSGPLLFIDKEGNLLYTGHNVDFATKVWQHKTGAKLEAGKWYNIAVAVRVSEKNADDNGGRLPFDVYVDGKCVVSYDALKNVLDGEGKIAIRPTTTDFTDPENVTIRLSDGGFGGGGNQCKMAMDNVRIYTGKELDTDYLKAGDYNFEGTIITVDFPTKIDWVK